MFENFKTARAISAHIDAANAALVARENPTRHILANWEVAEFLTEPLKQAASLATNYPKQAARVFDAIDAMLASPTMTPTIEQALLDCAATLPLDPAREIAKDTLCVDLNMGLLTVAPHRNNELMRKADGLLQRLKINERPDMTTTALCNLAAAGCAYNNWKASALLDAVATHLTTTDQLEAVVHAVPNFLQRIAEVRVIGREQIETLLGDTSLKSDSVKELSVEFHAERALNELYGHHLNPSQELALFAQAARDPGYRVRAAASIINALPQIVRSEQGEVADRLLCILNMLSGEPLKPFNTLASRELYIGPVAKFEAELAGETQTLNRRVLVAAAEEYDTDFDVSRANDLDGFTLTHGPVTLGPIGVLKLHIKGFTETDDTDRLRRATFGAATEHLGESEISLAAAWGALCVQSGIPQTKQLGAKLIAASLKLNAA